MKPTYILSTTLCLVVILASCTKKQEDDKTNNTTSSAKQQLLEAGKWQLSAKTATINYMGKDTTADLYPDVDNCEKDDFVEFFSNKTVIRNENIIKCNGNPQSSTFTWQLLDNESKIAIYDSNPDTLNLEVSQTQLKLSQTKPNSSGIPVTFKETYKNIK
ncbi:MAG: lipocalin family protein [Flavipsychrobacter sp.]